jgi:ribonuclease HI
VAKHTDRELLRLVRQHLDVDGLLAAHHDVSRADLDALWRRHGVADPPPRQTELFEEASPGLTLIARCDGAARGNPGPAAIGAVIQDLEGDTLLEVSECIGRATNNVAEYRAVIAAIEQAMILRCSRLRLLLDSDLLVNQLTGRYKVRTAHLRPLRDEALGLLGKLDHWSVQYVPRQENAEADALANRALDAAKRCRKARS